jgi:hypothetical protein
MAPHSVAGAFKPASPGIRNSAPVAQATEHRQAPQVGFSQLELFFAGNVKLSDGPHRLSPAAITATLLINFRASRP